LRGQRRLIVIGAMIATFLLFPALENTGLLGARYFRDANEDQSAATHEALWEVSLAVALDNPVVGIGHEHFERVSLDYLDAVDDESRAISGAEAVGEQRPHNDFLSVWMSWGIFALLAYLAIFIGALRNLVIATRHPDQLIRGLAVGCAGGLIVYGVNSAFHNYLDSSVFLWAYAGLSVSLARLATQRVNRASMMHSQSIDPAEATLARP
jgi:O-antigen ligase